MNKMTALSLFFIANMAQANEVFFKKDNPMPKALQQKVAILVKQNCAKAFDISLDVFEVETDFEIDQVDQGIRDYYFSTKFSVTLQNDPYHFEPQYITVKSAQFAGSNPSPDMYGEVLSLTSENNLCQDFNRFNRN